MNNWLHKWLEGLGTAYPSASSSYLAHHAVGADEEAPGRRLFHRIRVLASFSIYCCSIIPTWVEGWSGPS
jgi:hypothetical protein